MQPHEVETVHDYWIDVDRRQIWIRGIEGRDVLIEGEEEPGVEYQMAARTAVNLNLLRAESPTKPAMIHMITCGGSWEYGMAIYDAIAGMPYEITILSYAHARSMSSIILQAADHRVMMPSSYFMLHYGSLELAGDAKTVEKNAEQAKKDTAIMVDIYVDLLLHSEKFSGRSERYVRKKVKEYLDSGDVFLTPKEAIEWNLADSIFDGWYDNGAIKCLKK